MRLTTQNLKHGGTQSPTGAPDDRWREMVAHINTESPDILAIQEIHGWRHHNHQQLWTAQRDLDMRVAGWIPPVPAVQPQGGTLVLYRPRRAALEMTQWESMHATTLRNGLGVPVFHVAGHLTIAAASVHLPPEDAATARAEAAFAAGRVSRYGGLGVLMGDINHHPAVGEAPDASQVPALNRMGRWKRTSEGTLVPDRRVGQALEDGEMVDAAAHIAATHDRPECLAPTAPGQIRVDQIHVTAPLARAIMDYRRISHDLSDHDMISVDLDPELVDTADITDVGWG